MLSISTLDDSALELGATLALKLCCTMCNIHIKFESMPPMSDSPCCCTDCYAYGLLAAGFLDLVVEASLKPYDYMPLVAIVEGAGGVITDWEVGRVAEGAPALQGTTGNVGSNACLAPLPRRAAQQLLPGSC